MSLVRNNSPKRESTDEVSLKDFISLALRSWKLALLYTIIVAVFSGLELKKNPLFTAKGTILVETPSNNSMQALSEKMAGLSSVRHYDAEEQLDRYLLFLRSKPLQEKIAATLYQSPEFHKYRKYLLPQGIPAQSAEKEIQELAESLMHTVNFDKSGISTLQTNITLSNIDIAIDLVNIMQKEAVFQLTELESEELNKAKEFLQLQIKQAEDRMSKLEAEFFRQKVAAQKTKSKNRIEMDKFNSKLTELQSELINMKLEYEQNSTLIESLRESQSNKTAIDSNEKYNDKIRLQNLVRENSLLAMKIDSYEKVVKSLAENSAKYMTNDQDIDDISRKKILEQELYSDLKKEILNIEMQKISSRNKVRILSNASEDAAVINKRFSMSLIQRIILAILFAVATTYFLDFINPVVLDRKQLNKFNLFYLGFIPAIKEKSSLSLFLKRFNIGRHFTNESTQYLMKNSIYNLAIKNMRTFLMSIMQTNDNHRPQVIASMGTHSGEGTSTLCFNLAASLSQIGKKVLIIDANLRYSDLSHGFCSSSDQGLSEYLQNPTEKFHKPLVKKINNRLDLLPAGLEVEDPTELLSSSYFAEVVSAMKNYYEYIFIDAPSILLYSECLNIANASDLIIFNITAKSTRIDHIEKALERLGYAGRMPIAYVLNKYNDPVSISKIKNRFSKNVRPLSNDFKNKNRRPNEYAA